MIRWERKGERRRPHEHVQCVRFVYGIFTRYGSALGIRICVDKYLRVSVCVCVCVQPSAHSVVSNSLHPHRRQPMRLLCPWNFPCKNTGADCRFLLWGSSQPRDRTCVSYVSCIGRQVLYHQCSLGSPCSELVKPKERKKKNHFIQLTGQT